MDSCWIVCGHMSGLRQPWVIFFRAKFLPLVQVLTSSFLPVLSRFLRSCRDVHLSLGFQNSCLLSEPSLILSIILCLDLSWSPILFKCSWLFSGHWTSSFVYPSETQTYVLLISLTGFHILLNNVTILSLEYSILLNVAEKKMEIKNPFIRSQTGYAQFWCKCLSLNSTCPTEAVICQLNLFCIFQSSRCIWMDSWPRYATSSWFWVVRCSCVIKFSSMESEKKWNIRLCLICLENAYSGIAFLSPFLSASWKWEWENIPWKLQSKGVGAVLLSRAWHPETEIPSC